MTSGMRLHLSLLLLTLGLGINFSYCQVIKGTFAIKNAETGVLLRPLDANHKNGTPIVAYSQVNWKCVTWDFKNIADQTYQLQNLFTSKTFEPAKLNPVDGDGLKQMPLTTNQSSQLFEFIPVRENSFMIRLKNTELYLTPSDVTGTINAPILLKKASNNNTQVWILVEQHPTM